MAIKEKGRARVRVMGFVLLAQFQPHTNTTLWPNSHLRRFQGHAYASGTLTHGLLKAQATRTREVHVRVGLLVRKERF